MAATNSPDLEVSMPTDRELVLTRVFNAPRALVFEAYTSPEYLPHWMLGPPGWTMPVCEADLRVGGAWHCAWAHSNGGRVERRGGAKEVVPPGAVGCVTARGLTPTADGWRCAASIRRASRRSGLCPPTRGEAIRRRPSTRSS